MNRRFPYIPANIEYNGRWKSFSHQIDHQDTLQIRSSGIIQEIVPYKVQIVIINVSWLMNFTTRLHWLTIVAKLKYIRINQFIQIIAQSSNKLNFGANYDDLLLSLFVNNYCCSVKLNKLISRFLRNVQILYLPFLKKRVSNWLDSMSCGTNKIFVKESLDDFVALVPFGFLRDRILCKYIYSYILIWCRISGSAIRTGQHIETLSSFGFELWRSIDSIVGNKKIENNIIFRPTKPLIFDLIFYVCIYIYKYI